MMNNINTKEYPKNKVELRYKTKNFCNKRTLKKLHIIAITLLIGINTFNLNYTFAEELENQTTSQQQTNTTTESSTKKGNILPGKGKKITTIKTNNKNNSTNNEELNEHSKDSSKNHAETSNISTSNTENNTYSPEMNQAYQFAYTNGITNKPTITEANMDGNLTRIQMAKMLSYYAINILGQTPNISKGSAKFNDVSNEMNKQYNNAVTLAYQLGIMGVGTKNFRPKDEVTRAEFTTALSRMLYDIKDGSGNIKYYEPHINKLHNEGIINNPNPELLEKRGYVMLMLMRSVK